MIFALGLSVVGLITGSARASRSDYVGSKACAPCHQEAYKVWRQSAHARADQRLGPAPNPACLGCHTTGEAPAGRAFFAGIGCEACHGPGAGYAEDDIMRNPTLARLLGLRDLSTRRRRAALCAGCHGAQTRLAPFDPEAALRRIEHR
ncbi:MAG: cytochrome c family protein [Proteobacteria bacterium]|nr:cytochrome c family protein [Pseudomonadota bacterium]